MRITVWENRRLTLRWCIVKGLERMRSSAAEVSLMTAVKMMSFGVPLGCEDPVLTRHQALSLSAKISSFIVCSSSDGFFFFFDLAFCLIAELG
jgi:hypothetical protein